MKRLLKLLGFAVLGILLVILIFGLYIQTSGIPSYDRPDVQYTASVSPEGLENGKKLVMTLCAGCHRNSTSGKLSGKHMLDVPKEFGTVYSPNITQDPEYGIGNYSDADLLILLRTGLLKNGRYAPPYMAKLPLMADEDINDIIAFLKSDDPAVSADPTPDQECEPSFLNKLLCNLVFKPLPMPENKISLPDQSDPVEWGEYLVHNLDCYACHAADFKEIDVLNPKNSLGYMGGGNPILDEKGNVIPSSNISPHKENGIGNWSKERFVKAVKYGQMEGEPNLRYPMLPYSLLSDEEAEAMYAYLMTIPPIDNEVSRAP